MDDGRKLTFIGSGFPDNLKWKERIVCDPDILLGKPTIKGTRISVELILGCLAGGWTEAMIFESYSHITREDLRAYSDMSTSSWRQISIFHLFKTHMTLLANENFPGPSIHDYDEI